MIINRLLLIPRNLKIGILLASDAVLVVICILLSFSLRLGFLYFPSGFIDNKIFWLILISPFIGIPIFFYFGLYREVIRYLSAKTILNILKAVALYSIFWGLISMLAKAPDFPRSVVLINFMVAFIGIAGSRVLAKNMFSKAEFYNQKDDNENISHKKRRETSLGGKNTRARGPLPGRAR